MAIVAALAHNLIIGAIFGTFSVMLASVVERLHVSTEAAAVGIPVTVIGSSILASVAGVLIARYSLRLMILIGALLTAGAFVLLAYSSSYLVYILAYGVLIGPGMALAGSVGPATVVTRWFTRNRGLALGLVHLPIAVAVLPIASNWMVERHGASATYLALAALIMVVLVPASLLVRDYPPGQGDDGVDNPAGDAPAPPDRSLTIAQLLSRPQFWMLAFASAAVSAGAVTLGSVLIPMATSWGYTRGDAAILASIMAGVGIVGSVLFGWVADRIGGARGLATIALTCALLWGLLLFQPPFAALAVVIGLIGMCGAGLIPNLSRALADAFGAPSFSRGFGLATTLGLPLTVAMVPGFPAINTAFGSYSPAIIVLVVFYLASFVCALAANRPFSAQK